MTTYDPADPRAYITAHDKRVVRLDRLAVAHLNTIWSDALGNTLIYTGPMGKDELVSAIAAIEFPRIGEAREAYVNLMVG